MKIVFFEVREEEHFSALPALDGVEVLFLKEKLNESNIELAKGADIICIFVNSTINKTVIDAIPNLKFIATRSTGFNHIDCEYATSKGIKISNVPAYGSHTVAEFTFGLLLGLSRKIVYANDYVRESSDFNFSPKMEGFDLNGKTLGVIGTGKIGRNVIKIAKAFGMNVIAYDLYPDIAFAKENNFAYKNLEDILSESDILTLHVPYCKENHNLINKDNVLKMKKGMYLVNTARGELIETEALYLGLKDGTITGFASDVLEGEVVLKDEKNVIAGGKITEEEKKMLDLNHELINMPNTLITPHIAFYSNEAVASIVKTSLDNISGFIANNPINLVK